MTIDERDFRGIDLNLLVVLHVLIRERSVSRAAERLFLGQPAVSGALARLRKLFDDELLVRTGHSMAPTTRALSLYAQLGPALETVRGTIVRQADFDPAVQQRVFRVGMRDWVESWLMPGLLEALPQLAPGVRIAVLASDASQGTRMLDSDDMDLGVSVFPPGPPWQRNERLTAMRYRCVYDGTRLALPSPLSLEDYLAHPHLVTPPQAEFHGVVDDELGGRKKRRTVLYTTTRLGALPFILKKAAVIATVPEQAAQAWSDAFGLTSSLVPVPIAPFELSMIWHAKRETDPGLQWLRGVIRSLVEVEMERMNGAVGKASMEL